MKISELTPGTGNVNLEVEVVSVSEPREINKYGRQLRVADVVVRDDSGSITLVLWNDNIDKVSVGAKAVIKNGYVNTWQDKVQLTLGKFGSVEVQ
ncbi:MAG: DNA-binding protein [Candidatus Micrarchaeota archaeon]